MNPPPPTGFSRGRRANSQLCLKSGHDLRPHRLASPSAPETRALEHRSNLWLNATRRLLITPCYKTTRWCFPHGRFVRRRFLTRERMAGKIAEPIRFSTSQSTILRLLARFAVARNSRAGQNLLRPIASTDQTRATVAAHLVHLRRLPIRSDEVINQVPAVRCLAPVRRYVMFVCAQLADDRAQL